MTTRYDCLITQQSFMQDPPLKVQALTNDQKIVGKIVFGFFFLTLNPFSCLTYGKTPRTNANPDERLLDTIVWRHSKASGKTHHVLVINITSSGTYRALALHIDTFWCGQRQLNFSPMPSKLLRTYPHIVEKRGITMAPLILGLISWKSLPQSI